jgi:hypothetical protein
MNQDIFADESAQIGKDLIVLEEPATEQNQDLQRILEIQNELETSMELGIDVTGLEAESNAIKERIRSTVPTISTNLQKTLDARHSILDDYIIEKINSKGVQDTVRNFPVNSVSTDMENNALRVGVHKALIDEKNAEQIMKQVRDVVGYDIDVTLVAEEPYLTNACSSQTGDCEPIKGGVKIVIDGSEVCSSGFKASYDGKTGFVTAGHCGDANDSVGNPSGWFWDDLGDIYEEHFEHNSYCDCAFVDSDESVDDQIYSGYEVDAATNPGYWDAVIMKGQTSGSKAGFVSATSYSTYVDGVYIKDMVQTTYVASGGDSGGPIMESGTTTPELHGIQSGSNGNSSVFSKSTRADDEFSGLTWTFT